MAVPWARVPQRFTNIGTLIGIVNRKFKVFFEDCHCGIRILVVSGVRGSQEQRGVVMRGLMLLMKVLLGAAFVSGLVLWVGLGVSQEVLIREAAWGPVMVLMPVIVVLLLLSTWQIQLLKKN